MLVILPVRTWIFTGIQYVVVFLCSEILGEFVLRFVDIGGIVGGRVFKMS
jgi:hypothetical protein